jgi:predicted SAM-dependent methyltransferase
MRIGYIGNFSQSHCTEVHIAATLEDLGHEVMRLQENELVPGWCVNLPPDADLLLYTRTWGQYVTLDDLAELKRRGIPTASYHLDLYVGLQREDGLDNDPFWKTDYVFTPDGSQQAADVFKAKGINHFYMKPAVFKGECYIKNYDPAVGLGNNVIFVGGGSPTGEGPQYGHREWPYRGQLLKFLQETYGVQYSKYGHPQETIRNDKLNQLYANSKVVVGDSLCLGFDHPYYWSDRVYETLGRGGFLIHPYIKGMEEEFTDRKNIVFYEYNNFAQLRELIDYYLIHDDEREMIRRAGYGFVKENATYYDRLAQMLEIIDVESTPTFGYDLATLGGDRQVELLVSGRNGRTFVSPFRINLGSGADPAQGFINVDLLDLPEVDVVHNLLDFPYPFEDESATHIRAVDVLEHLPNYTDDRRPMVIAFIEECYRILKPGGELYIQTPGYDAEFLWQDPTHVRGFHPKSMDLFDPETEFGATTGFYSEAKFKVRVEQLENRNLRYTMVKI